MVVAMVAEMVAAVKSKRFCVCTNSMLLKSHTQLHMLRMLCPPPPCSLTVKESAPPSANASMCTRVSLVAGNPISIKLVQPANARFPTSSASAAGCVCTVTREVHPSKAPPIRQAPSMHFRECGMDTASTCVQPRKAPAPIVTMPSGICRRPAQRVRCVCVCGGGVSSCSGKTNSL